MANKANCTEHDGKNMTAVATSKNTQEKHTKSPKEVNEPDDYVVRCISELLEAGYSDEDIIFMTGCRKHSIAAAKSRMKQRSQNQYVRIGKKRLDVGKIQALYNARWSVCEIAAEMKTNDDAIITVLTQYCAARN